MIESKLSKKFNVLFFATFKSLVGQSRIELEIEPPGTVRQLKNKIVEIYPVLKDYENIMIVSADRKFVLDDDIITDGAEIALFPPVSGG